MSPNVISIDGVDYVKASEAKEMANLDGLPYVIVRGDRSGVFAGYLSRRDGREVELRQSRRIWYWSGAASISQLANDGTSDPINCKFPEAVESQLILDAIEVIPATENARKSIEGVKPWAK